MKLVSLVIPDPPPTRERVGRAADRDSPNAKLLAAAAQAMIDANPGTFPLTFSSYNVVFGKTLPKVDGYEPHHAVYEVLQDVGLVIEPEAWELWTDDDPLSDFYVASYVLDDKGSDARSPETSNPPVALTVVVPDPPPDRAVPGRAADRDSPKAKPLVRAAEAMIALKPEAFPFAFSSFNVTFGKTFPDAEGHGPEDPVYEVLQNVGLVTQPGVARENIGHDASSEFYVATFRFLEP